MGEEDRGVKDYVVDVISFIMPSEVIAERWW